MKKILFWSRIGKIVDNVYCGSPIRDGENHMGFDEKRIHPAINGRQTNGSRWLDYVFHRNQHNRRRTQTKQSYFNVFQRYLYWKLLSMFCVNGVGRMRVIGVLSVMLANGI